MWLTPYASSLSSTASTRAGFMLASAAAPKIARLLAWPVRPKAILSITGAPPPTAGATRLEYERTRKPASSVVGVALVTRFGV